jgi:small nuclear ribonucleoprotein (snRNP)-like protein
MTYPTEPLRRLTSKLLALIDTPVTVILRDGRKYTGVLAGIDTQTLTLALRDARTGGEEEHAIPLIIIRGDAISEIISFEYSVFDPEEFAEFLVRHGGIERHLIRVYKDLGVVEIGRGIRVTKDGVEGSGALAHRAYSLFREYMRQKGVKLQ